MSAKDRYSMEGGLTRGGQHLFQTLLTTRMLALMLGTLLSANRLLASDKAADALEAASPTTTGTPTAAQIFERVINTYRNMPTYQSDGVVLSEIDTGNETIHTQTAFTICLKKPNHYLIRWTQKNATAPNSSQQGAVWSDGKHPFLYLGAMNAYGKMGSDPMALGGAMGVSGGCVYTIPALYLLIFKEQLHPFHRLQEPKIEASENIDDEECYVISGTSTISNKETFWISKSRSLVLKYRRSLTPPEGGVIIPEMTDQQVAEALQGLGQEITAESMKKMRTLMNQSKALFEMEQMKGSVTESHKNISSPNFKPENFQFTVPEGTELKESLLSGMLGEGE
jgi:hypothetical protein